MDTRQQFLMYILPLILVNLVSGASLGEDAEKAITDIFPNASLHFESQPLQQSAKTKAEQAAKQRFSLDKLFIWQVRQNNETIAYALMDNVVGKVQPITYLGVYTNDLDIRHVQVLRYREQIGGAVQNQQWLKQFRGTSPESSFERGKDVDGITGATISVDALISGLKRMSVYLSLIKGDLTNHERK